MTEIKVRYSSIDGCKVSRKFKTLKGASKFAKKYVGRFPEFGSTYAVSGDGVGKITCEGVTLAELFPEPVKADDDWLDDFNYVGSRHHY